jgi:predicted nucleic acid-binding protein
MIFVDTWAWIALALKGDKYHHAAKAQHASLRRARRRYVTTDYVLAELVTQLYRLLPAKQAQTYIESVLQATDAGLYQLVFVSPGQFHRGWQLRQKYHDKPGISFVDFTSMVVMQDIGISEVFTGDAHFRQVGLGFRLVP